MVEKQIIEKLWGYGHYLSTPYTLPLALDNGLTSVAGLSAARSYISFFEKQFEELCNVFNYPQTIYIGDELNPAFVALFEIPRCGCPDYTEDGVGSGSWPVGCHSDWPNNHAFTIQVNKSGMPSFLNTIFEDAFDLCRAAYADIGIAFVREDNNNKANTLVTWQRGAGWLGLAIVARNPKCNERIWAKFDNRYQPKDLTNQWARLLTHEFGHNMGMGHSRGGIMNPSLLSGEFKTNAWRGDPSEPILTRYFGGEPITQLPPPLPPEEPPTGSFNLGFALSNQGLIITGYGESATLKIGDKTYKGKATI